MGGLDIPRGQVFIGFGGFDSVFFCFFLVFVSFFFVFFFRFFSPWWWWWCCLLLLVFELVGCCWWWCLWWCFLPSWCTWVFAFLFSGSHVSACWLHSPLRLRFLRLRSSYLCVFRVKSGVLFRSLQAFWRSLGRSVAAGSGLGRFRQA